jgi:hypothetical protein
VSAMRHWTCYVAASAGVATVILSGLAIAGAATSEHPPPAPADAPIQHRSLAGDPAYLRQGAVTNLPTCLAIADDRDADRLAHDLFENFQGSDGGEGTETFDEQAAGWLVGPWSLRKSERGFGTLLACAEVVAAWHAALPDRENGSSPQDGRIEHGAVVLDLGYREDPEEQVHKTAIAPGPLVRLLNSPSLLPSTAFGGIVIRNAIIDGTLLLYDLRLTTPLVFADVTFKGSRYSKAIFGQGDIAGTALSILNSKFNSHVLFSNVNICGDVRIYDNHFLDNLDLIKIRQYPADCQARPGAAQPFVHIGTTQFSSSLKIVESTFGQSSITSNNIESLLIADSNFGAELNIEDNDIGTVQTQSSYLGETVSINYNRIANDFFIEGADAPSVPMAAIGVTSNRIGGGLGFKFPEASLPSRLDLRSNHVGNGSQICLPPAWRGDVTLAGSSYAGTLTIGLNASPGADGQQLAGSGAPEDDELTCPGPFRIDDDRMRGIYCGPAGETSAKPLAVDLMATQIRTLKWYMPITCDYRWSGFGLTYDLWLVHPSHTEREAAFHAWRTTLSSYEPASLDMMSRYLAGKGAYVASRDIQIEAKRLNYAPDCPPHENLWQCVGRLFDPPQLPWLSSAQAAATPDDANGDRPASWRRVWQAFKLVLLWPGGFGAQPERAILLLIGGMVFFAVVYWGYIRLYEAQYRVLLAAVRVEARNFARLRKPSPEGEDDKLVTAAEMLSELERHDEAIRIIREEIAPELRLRAGDSRRLRLAVDRLLQRAGAPFGETKVYGFSAFNKEHRPTRFTALRYSIDTMIPVIDLHAYSSYYPEWWPMRGVTVIQHICGWWWLTVFVASAAIL